MCAISPEIGSRPNLRMTSSSHRDRQKVHDTHLWRTLSKSPYTFLSGVMLSTWLLYGVLPANIANVFASLFALGAMGVTLKALRQDSRLFWIYATVAVFAAWTDLVYWFFATNGTPIVWLRLVTAIVLIGATLLAIYFTIQHLFSRPEVTGDTVIGGICLFLTIGMLWHLLYYTFELVYPGTIVGPHAPVTEFDLLYFSFTTLTTVGYGEFTPVTKVAKIFANFESIVGVIYPATFIASLVSSYNAKD